MKREEKNPSKDGGYEGRNRKILLAENERGGIGKR